MSHVYIDNPSQEIETKSADGKSHSEMHYTAIPGCNTDPPVLLRAFCHKSVGIERDTKRLTREYM